MRQLAVGLLLFLSLAGCQNIAGLAANATGAAAIPAQYTPQKVTTLILAEHSSAATADDGDNKMPLHDKLVLIFKERVKEAEDDQDRARAERDLAKLQAGAGAE